MVSNCATEPTTARLWRRRAEQLGSQSAGCCAVNAATASYVGAPRVKPDDQDWMRIQAVCPRETTDRPTSACRCSRPHAALLIALAVYTALLNRPTAAKWVDYSLPNPTTSTAKYRTAKIQSHQARFNSH